MNKMVHKKKTIQIIISYSTLFIILGVAIVFFYKDYSQKYIMADDFIAINYFDYFTSGINGLYPMIVLTLIPLLLNGFNAVISTEEADKFYIQRKGYHSFYKENILRSFVRGAILSILTNVFIFIFFSILDGFSLSNWSHIMFEENLLINFSEHQYILLVVFLEAIGMGVVSVALFFVTRYKVNRYFYYLSVIFFTALATTGVAAVMMLLNTITPLTHVLNNTISMLLSIFSPLSLIFPTQTVFSNSVPFEIRVTITFTFYIALIFYFGSRKYKKEIYS